MTAGHLVAELNFGFWTRLLDGPYDDWRTQDSRIWPLISNSVFTYCPSPERRRRDLHERFTEIKELRNRVFHDERLLHQVNLDTYDRCVEAVEWIDPDAARHLLTTDKPRIARLLAEKEEPFLRWLSAEVEKPGLANPAPILGLPAP